MVASRDFVVDYKSPAGSPVTQVRSTLLMSGIQTLRKFGHYDRYAGLLPRTHHERILFAIAPEWLPVDLAVLHYDICDALELSETELWRIGETVSEQIMGTLLGTLLRSGRNIGATPWIPLGQYDRLWNRILVGGACSVERVGPKDAIVRSFGIPMLESRYFRVAYQGVIRGAGLMFAKKLHASALPAPDATPHSAAVSLSWV